MFETEFFFFLEKYLQFLIILLTSVILVKATIVSDIPTALVLVSYKKTWPKC